MSDPYKILGVSPTATDEQVKAAYRELAKKYHPDNYSGSPIADLASEKMKEVNEAYDQVMSQRKSRKNGSPFTGSANTGYQNYGGSAYSTAASSFQDVRSLIMSGRIADAEQILNGVPAEGRNAEWYFLKGPFYISAAGSKKPTIILPGRARWTRRTPSFGRRFSSPLTKGAACTAATIQPMAQAAVLRAIPVWLCFVPIPVVNVWVGI